MNSLTHNRPSEFFRPSLGELIEQATRVVPAPAPTRPLETVAMVDLEVLWRMAEDKASERAQLAYERRLQHLVRSSLVALLLCLAAGVGAGWFIWG